MRQEQIRGTQQKGATLEEIVAQLSIWVLGTRRAFRPTPHRCILTPDSHFRFHLTALDIRYERQSQRRSPQDSFWW